MNVEKKWYIRAFLLFTLVCIFGVGIVYLEHQKRELFSDYQNLIKERDVIQVEWKKLQIQSSESSSGLRLENIARSKANMKILDADVINIIDVNEDQN
jgi:cell division protein FtsL